MKKRLTKILGKILCAVGFHDWRIHVQYILFDPNLRIRVKCVRCREEINKPFVHEDITPAPDQPQELRKRPGHLAPRLWN